MEEQKPLHAVHVDKLGTAINRAHLVIHSLLVSLFLYRRLSLLLAHHHDVAAPPLLPSLLLFLAELLLSFLWLSDQSMRWRLVDRAVFIDRLPDDDSQLPALDVFVCTADPNKEPTVEVMNTVVSAMALDYPPSKLHVYLSDDGGAAVTLTAMKEAWLFSTWWVPFCRQYKVGCRCPMSYFGDQTTQQQQGTLSSEEFIRDRRLVQEKYEEFKRRVEINLAEKRIGTETDSDKERWTKTNHPSIVEVH